MLRTPGDVTEARMGRPPLSEEEKNKRAAIKKELEDRRRIKRELKLAALQERARLGRPKLGRPRKDPTILSKSRSKFYKYNPDSEPVKIKRPPAVYDNKSPYDKYEI